MNKTGTTPTLPTTSTICDVTGLSALGTVLAVWAHPDDEAYLAGGVMAALRDDGARVVCVTATRGEAADPASGPGERAELAALRTRELEASLGVLGVTEHHWLGYADGTCADVDPGEAVATLARLVDDVRPDTVLTFGPDGFTGHPDHSAVGAWTGLAVARATVGPRVLHAVKGLVAIDPELDDDFGVFELGRPRQVSDDELVVRVTLDGAELDRKVEALLRQVSQTGGLVEAVGRERFAAWVATETFAEPLHGS